MYFRFSIGLAYFLFALNIGDVFNIARVNPILKTFFILAALIYVVTRPRDWSVLLLLVLCLLMVLFLGGLTDYPEFQWSLLFGALNQFVVPYLLLAGKPTERDRGFFLHLMAWMAVGASVLGLIYGAMGVFNPFPVEYNTGAPRFSGTMNAAFLGGYALCGMFASYKLGERGETKYYWLIGINFLILVATGARMALALAVFLMLLTFYLSPRVTLKTKLLASLGGLFLALVAVPLVWIRYAARLEASGSSGRDVMWPWLWSMSEKFPDYGIGYGHQFWATPREVFILFTSNAAHNDYLRLLVELGWFGVFAFYGLFIGAVLIVWFGKVGRRDNSILFCLAAYLALSITDNALATPAYFTLIIISVMAAQSTKEQPRVPARQAPRRDNRPGAYRRRMRAIGSAAAS